VPLTTGVLLRKDATYGGATDFEAFGDLAFTESSGEEPANFGAARFNGRWSAMRLALLSSLRDSSLDVVAQDFAFKLGENG
jgi:hypothetical protein